MAAAIRNIISVFEHQSIYLHDKFDGVVFNETLLKALQDFYGKSGVPYFSLLNKGVKFCEQVGVIQIGKTTIEILPKADNNHSAPVWREVLIDMLRSVGLFKIKAPTSSSLKVKPNSILDLYIELFIQEAEYLLHTGLVKKYRKTDSNCSSLKGNILFASHIQKNLVHKEHFYTRHTVYDDQHLLNQVLYKTLLLLHRINVNITLQSRISSLLLNFPEQSDIKVSESTFLKISFTRKTEAYRKPIEIARLLLLNYHPNVSQGTNHVLALMFDMNLLWERFVLSSIRGHVKTLEDRYFVTAQTSKHFWKPKSGSRSSIKPDILIQDSATNNCVVLDTKWKNLKGYNPSPDDLRQLYVYHEYYDAKKVALVYPGNFSPIKGLYYTKEDKLGDKECSIMGISVDTNIKQWRKKIAEEVLTWVKFESKSSDTIKPNDI